MGSLRLGNSLARFFLSSNCTGTKKKAPTPPGPSYSSSAALRAAPREGAPEPPRWPAPLGTLPRPPSGAVRPPHRAPGQAARTAPHRHAPRWPRPPRRAEDQAGQGELPPAPSRPNGTAPAAPGNGIPERDPPRRFGEGEGGLSPRQGCALPAALPHPRGRRAVQGEPGPTIRGPSPSAGERCPGPGPFPAARRCRCAKVPGTFCAPSSGGSAAAPGPGAGLTGARVASGHGRALPSLCFPRGGKVTARVGAGERRSVPSGAGARRPQRSAHEFRRSMRGGHGDVPGAAGARRRATGGGGVPSLPSGMGGNVPGVPRGAGAV